LLLIVIAPLLLPLPAAFSFDTPYYFYVFFYAVVCAAI